MNSEFIGLLIHYKRTYTNQISKP